MAGCTLARLSKSEVKQRRKRRNHKDKLKAQCPPKLNMLNQTKTTTKINKVPNRLSSPGKIKEEKKKGKENSWY